MKKIITNAAAMAVTGLSISMAASSTTTRAATPHAQAILACLSAAVVVAVHVAPAWLRRVPRLVLWPVWSLCLAGALWAHASFLAAASAEAGAARQAASPAAAARAAQRADIEQALSQIRARPTATIARQLSWTTDQSRAAALHLELGEARRADALREQLVALSAGTAADAASATADPLSMTLARMLGVSSDAVALAVSLLLAVLIEVLGMLLWMEALAGKRDVPAAQAIAQPAVPAVMHQTVQVNVQRVVQAAPQAAHNIMQGAVQEVAALLPTSQASDIDLLRAAVARGECQPTLAGIRKYMRCGQQKASDLRAALYSA